MRATDGQPVSAVHLVTSDADAARPAPDADTAGLAAWAGVIALVMALTAVGALVYGWWRVRRSPLDRALLALSIRWRVWRRADRRALRTLAALSGATHACALLVSPVALGRALAAHGGQIDAGSAQRLRRRVVEA